MRPYFLFSLLLLSACAHTAKPQCIPSNKDDKQTITVTSSPIGGAMCKLSNEKGSWLVPVTPGAASVARSRSKLFIHCERLGYLPSTQTLESSAQNQSVAYLLGRAIGTVSRNDSENAYAYPESVTVIMFLTEQPAGYNIPK